MQYIASEHDLGHVWVQYFHLGRSITHTCQDEEDATAKANHPNNRCNLQQNYQECIYISYTSTHVLIRITVYSIRYSIHEYHECTLPGTITITITITIQ